MLIDQGAVVNDEDIDGFSPLHLAAAQGKIDVAEILLNNGANVSAYDHQKQTPLHLAAETGQPEMCQLLIDKGAEINGLDAARRSPEILARRNEHYEVVRIITAHQDKIEDEDAPIFVFKPFTGVKYEPFPPNIMDSNDIDPEDFKFHISMD